MSVAQVVPTYTPDDLLRMPDNSTMELVNGQILDKNASTESSEIELLVGFRFQAFLVDHPVARAYSSSLGYQCFDDDPTKIRKPDASVIRKDRLEKLSDPNPGYMPLVPDLAVEVISPNDVVYEVDAKVKEYLDAGFPLIWVVDPMAKTVTVHPLHARPTLYSADDELTAENAMPGFRCKVSDLFPVDAR